MAISLLEPLIFESSQKAALKARRAETAAESSRMANSIWASARSGINRSRKIT